LSRRIIDLPHIFKNVEGGIYNAIKWELRGLPNVVCAESKGLTEECDFEIEGEGLLDAVLTVIKESNYGIRANFDHVNKQHVIEVYEGVDRSYDSENGGTVFSQEFGNLRSLVVTEDDDLYKNVAYVTGASDTSPETIYYQYVSPDAGPQENWREIIVNGENQKEDEDTDHWQARQKQLGIEALQAHKSALSFEVELGLGVFGEKYDLGDSVTCKSRRYGLQFDARILEYKYAFKSGVETVTVVLGDRPLDYVQSSIVKSGGGVSSKAKPSGGGSTGAAGKDGEDGVGIQSVTQTTTSTADGGENIITVALTDGSANTFSIRNGSRGSTGPQGPAGSDGKDGADGKNGSDGYTPVRGTDYWTEADKQEIINEVSAVTGGGGSYTVTLSSSKWTKQSNGTYTQTATVSGVTASSKAIVDINMSAATTSTYATLSEAWFLIGRAYCVANGITFVCYEGAPETNLSVNVEVL